MTGTAGATTPTYRARRLAKELVELRRQAGKTPEQAAEHLECGKPKISKIENGLLGIRPLDLRVLLDFYDVPEGTHRDAVIRLAKHRNHVDWFSTHGPLLHDDMRDYLILEADSELVRNYESAVIPGIFQTVNYMRRIFEVNNDTEEIERQIKTRVERKERLTDDFSTKVKTIIDVSVLHRLSGGSQLVKEQLESLVHDSKLRNVTLQLLPQDVALPPEQYVPFYIFSLRDTPTMEIVWLDHLAGGTILEQQRDLAIYNSAWSSLTAAAMSPPASRQYIENLLKGLET